METLAELVKDKRFYALAEHAGITGEMFPPLRVYSEPRWAHKADAIWFWDAGGAPIEVEYLVRIHPDGTAEVIR